MKIVLRKYHVARFFMCLWIYLWILFLVRPFFIQNQGQEYWDLFNRTGEEKKEYIVGKDLYAYIEFCKNVLPAQSQYKFIGLEKIGLKNKELDSISWTIKEEDKKPVKITSIAGRRAQYYLMPHLPNKTPEYILVYKVPDYQKEGFEEYKRLDEGSFILKKMKE